MKSDYVSLWYTQFRKLRASKGSDLLSCNDTEFDLGSIQTGRANVKTTASLLYNFLMWRGRSECSDWLTCVPNQARSVLRRHFDADASGLNRPLHLVILNALRWQLPFHSTLVTRRPYLGHDNWRLRYRFFPHYKVPLTFRYSWKRLRKRRSKNLIKFHQVSISFVLQYVHCLEKNNTHWLNESWETQLPKRLKCTIISIPDPHYLSISIPQKLTPV